jgi:hypothetical protein
MASQRPTDHLSDADKAQLVAAGLCPYCQGQEMSNEGRLTAIRETLVDHCLHLFGEKHKPCQNGWLKCESCGAYGSIEHFVRL